MEISSYIVCSKSEKSRKVRVIMYQNKCHNKLITSYNIETIKNYLYYNIYTVKTTCDNTSYPLIIMVIKNKLQK